MYPRLWKIHDRQVNSANLPIFSLYCQGKGNIGVVWLILIFDKIKDHIFSNRKRTASTSKLCNEYLENIDLLIPYDSYKIDSRFKIR